MNRIKSVFNKIHIIVWILFIMLISLQLFSEGHPYALSLVIALTITCLYIFYGNFYLLSIYPGKKNKRTYLIALVCLIVTGPFPMLALYLLRQDSWDVVFESYRIHLVLTVPVFLVLSWVARVTENLVLNTIKKEQLEKQAVEAELYYLKSQINPHFLFNTLNNIHTLVYKQETTAPEAVLRLSSLMRYMIYESNAHTVPISREITYLQDYIGLQQLRYKNAGIVNLEIAGDTDQCYIAPLLFIHLIENAYKHSPARLEAGDIYLKLEIKENTLTFTCRNPVSSKQGNTLNEPGGIGLPNIKKRLALLYPDQHKLEIANSTKIFEITLTIYELHLHIHERKADLLYNR
jgi:sensor histidine kinase YesM